MAIYICQVAYFGFSDVISDLCIVEIVLWLIPENICECVAGGRARNGSRQLPCGETGLKWRSGEYILHYFMIHVGLWPETALAAFYCC